MKATSAIIVPILSLLLTSSPKGYTPEEIATIFAKPTGVTEQDQVTLTTTHESITSSSQDIAKSILGENGLLSTINSLSSPQLFQNENISAAEREAWTTKMELILQQACKSFIQAVNLNEFLSSNGANRVSSAQSNTFVTDQGKTLPLKRETLPGNLELPQTNEIVTTIAIGSAIVGAMYYLFSETKNNIDQAQLIILQTAEISAYRRGIVINILSEAGIPVPANATASQVWEAFKAADYGKRRHATADLKDWVAANQDMPYNSNLLEDDRDRFLDLTTKQGKVATKVVVDSSLTVLNVGWSNLIPGELPGALVDIASVYYSKGPTDLLESYLNVAGVSGNQDSLYISPTSTTIDDAKQVLAELQDKGAGGIGGTELENALSAFGSLYAKNDLDDNPLTLSYPEYTFFPQVRLTQNATKPDQLEGSFQIPEKYLNYFYDFLYTGSEGIVEWFKSYHKSLNSQVAIPQVKEGDDDQQCLEWQDGVCVVPGQTTYDQNNECNDDVVITDHLGVKSCLQDFLSGEPAEPKICARTITTPADWNGSTSYGVDIKSLTGSIIAQCWYMRRSHCDGSTSELDLLTSETFKTTSGETTRGWIIYDDYDCGSHYKHNLNMYDNTYDPIIADTGRHGLQVEYYGHFAERRIDPSPCKNQPSYLGNFYKNEMDGTFVNFYCDETSGKSYPSDISNYKNGISNGLFQQYYPDTHTLKQQFYSVNWELHGLLEEFYNTTILKHSCQYEYGQEHGDEWWYYANGTPERFTQYQNGLPAGYKKKWAEDGSLISCNICVPVYDPDFNFWYSNCDAPCP